MTNAQTAFLSKFNEIFDCTEVAGQDLLLGATIEDRETDKFRVYFNVDGSLQVNSEGHDYLLLDPELLRDILEMAEQAPDIYEAWAALT